MSNIPRIIIAGTHSGVGKTTIATGIMSAFTEMGLKVQAFKVGPDYIDPGYHTKATGYKSINLDSWLLGEAGVKELFQRHTKTADIAVIEGVMGLYDGMGSNINLGSTAHIAKLLNAPVILIVDAKGMSGSIAALVKGYCELDPDVQVKGVVLNRVASEKHALLLQTILQEHNQVQVIGSVKKNAVLPWPERHLGLIPIPEQQDDRNIFGELSSAIKDSLNLNLIQTLAQSVSPLDYEPAQIFTQKYPPQAKVKIAYAWDEAFNFYYQDNLDILADHGAELVKVSPLHDRFLPEGIHGLIIGGGFPELYLEELSANHEFITSLQAYDRKGLPIYAECGGMMYLTNTIIDFAGKSHQMAGLLPGTCKMGKKLAALGYYQGEVLQDNLLFTKNSSIKGHEFHYSSLDDISADFPWSYQLNKGEGTPKRQEGYAFGNLLAAYLHIHFASMPGTAERFIKHCQHFLVQNVNR